MARELGFLLKTYTPDLPYARRLIATFNQFNTEHLPLFVVASDEDLAMLGPALGNDIHLMSESRFSHHFVEHSIHGNSPGYVNQEIVKLAFWETDEVDTYVCVDSELVFLRPFGRADFMAAEGVPFTFLSEDAELRVDPEYAATYWGPREAMLRSLQEYLQLDEPRLLTIHGMAALSSRVLRSLCEELMIPRGLSYADLLQICPYEFSWYNFWLQKRGAIPLVVREPIFKTLHNASQHLEYKVKGVRLEDVARGYVGVVVNSGYSRAFGLTDFNEELPQVLARQYGYPTLLSAWMRRVTRRSPTFQRWIGLGPQESSVDVGVHPPA